MVRNARARRHFTSKQTKLIAGLTLRQRAYFSLIEPLISPLPYCQPYNQFGTSGTCIPATRDPAMKRIQNSLCVCCVLPC